MERPSTSADEYAYVLTCRKSAAKMRTLFGDPEKWTPEKAYDVTCQPILHGHATLTEVGPHSDSVKRTFYKVFNFLQDHDRQQYDDCWLIVGPRPKNRRFQPPQAPPPVKNAPPDGDSSSSVNDPKKEDESSSSSDIHDPRHYEPRRNPKPSSECKCYAREYDLKCMCANT